MRDPTQGPITGNLVQMAVPIAGQNYGAKFTSDPEVITVGSHILTSVLPEIWLSTLPDLKLEHVWYLSVASVATQVIISLVLLHRVMHARLD
jgi:hypothetical protein